MKLFIAWILLCCLLVLVIDGAEQPQQQHVGGDKCKGADCEVKSAPQDLSAQHSAQATEEYVVMFHHQYAKAGVASNRNMVARVLSSAPSSALIREYHFGPIWGFHGKLTEAQVAALKAQSSVRAIVKNIVYRVSPIISPQEESVDQEESREDHTASHDASGPESHEKTFVVASPQAATLLEDCVVTDSKKAASWGLARISCLSSQLSSPRYLASRGTGVHAYVVDTGVRVDHREFEGRASWGADFTGSASDKNNKLNQDMNGHGTHIAGTIGGKTFGVAKNVSIIAVRVLNSEGEGTTDVILQGLQYVYEHAQKTKTPSVVNLSLGGSDPDEALNIGVNHLIDNGVYVCIAAGNDAVQSGKEGHGSLADDRLAIIVGATDKKDLLSGFSNWGSMLTMLAPGSDIKSAWFTSAAATRTLSGTSMATSHVAGVVSMYLSSALLANRPLPTPAAMRDLLVEDAQKNVIHFHSSVCSADALKQRTTPNNLLSIVNLLASYADCA